MKKKILIFSIIIGFLATSCNKFLDINTNPNSPGTSSPEKILPLAIVNTASLINSLNFYGNNTVGYASDVFGVGGYGDVWTYNYATTDGNGYWSSGYSIMENLEYNIIDVAKSNPNYSNYAAVSKIIQVYNWELLVDNFNDIPYSQALLGGAYSTPVYDKATDIYPKLALTLDSAIAEINNSSANAEAIEGSSDPLFDGDLVKWKQFANTLKLRLIIRGESGATPVTFTDKTFSADGFLTSSDAVVNPGYGNSTVSSGVQTNPNWSTYVVDYTGTPANRDYIPAYFAFGYYDGHKLKDPARGAAVYYEFPNTPASQLGATTTPDQSVPPKAGAWYSGDSASVGVGGTTLGNNIGVMKGPNMGLPLMLEAEADFLKAEADIEGVLTGGVAQAKTDFNAGIHASFHYLYELPNGSLASGMNPDADADAYVTANKTSYLANFDVATNTSEQLEAIITQKYIALNAIGGFEAWNEYRRTGYPVSESTVIGNPYNSFASTQSQATRKDHLPTRLLYPASEYSTNGANVPSNISAFTSLIFWAK